MSRQLESLRAFVGDRPPHAWRRVPHVAVIAGGKGGVGASTVAALVAGGAARAGHATLLVDASAGNAPLATLLGVEPAHEPREVAHRLALAGVAAPHEISPAERRAALRRLSAHYPAYELVVIDAGATCDGVSSAIAAGAGRLVALTTDERLSLAATYALVKFAIERFERMPITVLVNRCAPADAGAAFGHVATAVEQFLTAAITPAGSVPDDDALGAAVEAGHSLLSADGPAAHAAALLAELLMHAGRGGHGRHVALQATP